MSVNSPPQPAAAQTPWSTVGERVRALRMDSGITVRELARRIGVSASHVSQVERGIGAFSVSTLYAVAAELGVPMNVLLEPDADGVEQSSRANAAPAVDLVSAGFVQRAADHPTIRLSDGPQWSRLTTAGESDAEFLEVVYAPGTAAPVEHIIHEGREYGVIIAGHLSAEVSGQATTLSPGDSIVFDSALPHRFWNEGDEEVRAIWFVRDRDAPSRRRT